MRQAANVFLYGGIGLLSAAMAWPDDQPLGWKFYVACLLGFCVAVKALMSRGLTDSPQDVTVVNKPSEPVPTTDEPQGKQA